jgi:hypothetical protein
MQKVALGKNLLRLLPVRPAPTARAGPEGLQSQPVLHNAHETRGTFCAAQMFRGGAADRRDAGGHRSPVGQHLFPGSGHVRRDRMSGRVERHSGGRAARLVAAPVGPVASALDPEEVVQVDPGCAASRNASTAGATSASGP